jgi:hypothetical protein
MGSGSPRCPLPDNQLGCLHARNGAVPPVRAAGKKSSEQGDRPSATRGPLYLVYLPFGPSLVAEPKVGLMALTVSPPPEGR